MVRVARGSYSDYIRPLELDAAGIIVPHVMSLADAQAVARTTWATAS
jgi:4-hydroxy-2-oxoheptanedioate aldolase